jgi:hypothetical protein
MGSFRALTIQSGVWTQVQDTDMLIVGGGVSATGTNPVLDLGASAAGVSAASSGRIRYNASTQHFEISENGGAYAQVSTGSGGGGYATIMEEGVGLTQRTTFNFIGAAITAVDNGGATRTDITLSQSPAGSTSVVGTGRLLTGGTGINTLGDLSADRTVSIDQTFAPTWTNTHTFSNAAPITLSSVGPTIAVTGADGVLTLKGNRTAGSTGPDVVINTTATRTAGQLFKIQNNGTDVFRFDATGNGQLVPPADNQGSIGTNALRWNLVRAATVTSGDYAWDDETCADCGQPFVQGDRVMFKVRVVEPDERGKRISYGVPVHSTCTKGA